MKIHLMLLYNLWLSGADQLTKKKKKNTNLKQGDEPHHDTLEENNFRQKKQQEQRQPVGAYEVYIEDIIHHNNETCMSPLIYSTSPAWMFTQVFGQETTVSTSNPLLSPVTFSEKSLLFYLVTGRQTLPLALLPDSRIRTNTGGLTSRPWPLWSPRQIAHKPAWPAISSNVRVQETDSLPSRCCWSGRGKVSPGR